MLLDKYTAERMLLEMNYSSPGASTNSGMPPMWDGRRERLGNTWQSIIVQLEALWLDVLDASEEVYEQALPVLKDIRGSKPEMVWENLPRFKSLVRILKSAHGDSENDWKVHAGRMEYLLHDLQWACEELAPKDDRVPEAPPVPKGQWKAEHGKTSEVDPPDAVFEPAKKKGKQAAKEDKPDQVYRPKEKKNESTSYPSSLVMASLRRASDSISESTSHLESSFLSAGDAIRLCLEAHTDVDSAYVEIGESVPGSYPRLDVHVEWRSNGKPSDAVGSVRLFWENGTKDYSSSLIIEGKEMGWVSVDERVTDADVASRIYECLDVRYNPDARRVWERARVMPTLYRIIERVQRGESIPRYAVEETLSRLRTHIGMHHGVRLVSEDVNLNKIDEALGADVWQYYYDWEYWHEGSPDVRSSRYGGGSDVLLSPVKPATIGGEPTVNEAALVEAWATPAVRIDVSEGSVYFGEEKVSRDTTDEDAAARLVSLSMQKESVSSGFLAEWEQALAAEVNEAVWKPGARPQDYEQLSPQKVWGALKQMEGVLPKAFRTRLQRRSGVNVRAVNKNLVSIHVSDWEDKDIDYRAVVASMAQHLEGMGYETFYPNGSPEYGVVNVGKPKAITETEGVDEPPGLPPRKYFAWLSKNGKETPFKGAGTKGDEPSKGEDAWDKKGYRDSDSKGKKSSKKSKEKPGPKSAQHYLDKLKDDEKPFSKRGLKKYQKAFERAIKKAESQLKGKPKDDDTFQSTVLSNIENEISAKKERSDRQKEGAKSALSAIKREVGRFFSELETALNKDSY